MATIAATVHSPSDTTVNFVPINEADSVIYHPHLVIKYAVPIVQEEIGNALATRQPTSNARFSWGN